MTREEQMLQHMREVIAKGRARRAREAEQQAQNHTTPAQQGERQPEPKAG